MYPVLLAPNAFTAFYGRTGTALRQADTPAGRCANGDPAQEAQLRIREKLGKGYGDLGEHWRWVYPGCRGSTSPAR